MYTHKLNKHDMIKDVMFWVLSGFPHQTSKTKMVIQNKTRQPYVIDRQTVGTNWISSQEEGHGQVILGKLCLLKMTKVNNISTYVRIRYFS